MRRIICSVICVHVIAILTVSCVTNSAVNVTSNTVQIPENNISPIPQQTPDIRQIPDTPHAPDLLVVKVSFAESLLPYMRELRKELIAQKRYEEVSRIYPNAAGEREMDVVLDIGAIHTQYPFIDYKQTDTSTAINVTMDARTLASLLMAPDGLIPPASVQLSEAEVIEFYTWQIANAIPSERANASRIGELLAHTTITILLQNEGRPIVNSARQDSTQLLQLIANKKVMRVEAQY